jgi:amino acid adenylation domain-containing protein/non-ribosomal peptide synthase protein (TIGR01720 family)
VPMCFDKSIWTIVAMVSVLKAGGGCVMLNPDHPVTRLRGIVDDAQAKVVLCAPQHQDIFDTNQAPLLTIEPSFLNSLPSVPGGKFKTQVSPTNVAAVIFTSGSTGKPKGILVPHKNICSVSAQHCPSLGYHAGMRVLQFASLIFDMSNAEIFVTLMWGGTVCIPSDHDRLNNLTGVINSYKVDWMFLTPTVAWLVEPKEVPTLKTLVLGGEPSDLALLSRWSNTLKIINSYGPAECTMWTSHAAQGNKVPANIGRGVGCRMWLTEIGNHNRLTPLGCVGEIVIEGANVARGYLNEPQKSAEAFIDNPAWLHSNGDEPRRIYKTGDLGKYHADGTVLISGRKDTQVKLHGQRLELGEIEHHIRVRDDVEAVMVILPKAGPCKGRLVVALAFKEFEPESFEETRVTILAPEKKKKALENVSVVRNELSDHLPPYMVPTIWILLGNVPLTSSRKINRNPIRMFIETMSDELYAENVDIQTDGDTAMPVSDLEIRINEVWSRILDKPKDQIGVNRSFISLGGDSITAMRVVSQCRADRIDISVKDILQCKSLGALALKAKVISGSAAARKEEQFDTPFELSPIQQIYFDNIASVGVSGASGHHFNQSLLLSISRKVGDQDMAHAINEIVGYHSMLRAYFTMDDKNKWTQKVKREVAKAYHFDVHDVDSEEEMAHLIAARHCSMKILKGPLFKVDLFNFGEEKQMISLIAHHLIIDMVSWRVILQNLEELLEGTSAMTEKPLAFQTWNSMQAEQAKQLIPMDVLPFDVPAADIGYWGMSEMPNTYRHVEQDSFSIDEATTSLLFGDANNSLRTEPLDILLSSLLHSFSKVFPDRSPPTIYNESHGREPWDSSIDLSNTVGWFTTLTPLYVPVHSGSDIVDVVRHIKDIRRQIPENGRPYFSARHFNSEGSKSWVHHKDMEVTFNYLGRNQQLERKDALLKQESLDEKVNVGKDVRCLALFDISAVVTEGRFQFSFTWNSKMDHQDRIHAWFSTCEDSLRSAVDLLISSDSEYTLSDFPLLPVNYAGLSKLLDVTLPKIGVSVSNIESVYPCSPMQEGILLSQAREPGTYEVHQISQIVSSTASGPLDIGRLQRAWQSVVNYHAAMRTIFLESVTEDGVFDQLVLKDFAADFKLLQYTGEDVIAFLESQPGLQCTEPIPAHRVVFCEFNGNIFWRMDVSHALIDGTSMAILMRDFVLAYDNALPSASGPLYSDYISYLQSQPKSLAIESLKYWKDYLVDVEPCQFPSLMEVYDASAPMHHQDVTLNIAKESQLQSFCQQYGISLGNLFQAAWGLILRAYTGSDQTCFGYMASGRDVAVEGIDDAIGPFINILICRLDLEAKTGAQLVRQMQDDYLNSVPHQHTSLAKVQHALDMSGMALFNTVMSLQRMPADGPQPSISFDIAAQVDPSEVSGIQNTL